MKTLPENTKTELPEDFDATLWDEIPYSSAKIFIGSTPEMEKLARELIRLNLEKTLGTPVVSRETIGTRFGLRNLGFSAEDIMMGRIKIR